MPRTKKSGDIDSRQKKTKKAKKRIRRNFKKTDLSKIPYIEEAAFIGLDVHRDTVRASMMTKTGFEILNGRIDNTAEKLEDLMSQVPKTAKIVLESSSVWKAVFFQLRDELGFDVTLSNPYTTKLIATSKKKTDKVDARILADMHRGGFIAACHVPSKMRMANKDLVRYRKSLIEHRTEYKNFIHGVLLQNRIRVSGFPFTPAWIAKIREIGDYRIDENLRLIDSINGAILRMDIRVRDAVKKDPDAVLLQTIPGAGPYTALTVASEIDGIDRFSKSHKLCAYAGLVPSVRSSGETSHYGPITHRGSDILRWLMVECAHSHVRYAPKSSVTAFYNRLRKKRGSGRAAVATASKLLRVIYSMLQEKREFVTNYDQAIGGGR